MSDNPVHMPDAILDGQWKSWMEGSTPSVEELLQGTPFENNADAELDLVYNEIVVKEELGLQPREEDYLARYPHLKQDLKLHFEIHRAINLPELDDTLNPSDEKTWPESDVPLTDSNFPAENYEVIRELGRGGMAVVYQACHRQLQRRVALKMFQPKRLLSKRELFRIRTEAEAIARLSHPNIVQIFEIGECHGTPYLALELAERGTLAQKLRLFPYTADAAAKLIETLARALQHAHDRHVIHRDLKPANILFTRDGTPKITDFGLAKVLKEGDVLSSDATRTGETMGTPRYMAPEQAAGQLYDVGPATDVYALGNILYECLTGRAPFVSASVADTLQQIREDEPLPPRRFQPSIPIDLETICLHCLEKLPSGRYSSAAALADDLRRFQDHRPILARPTPLRERVRKWCQRRPTHAALIGFSIFAILCSVATTVVRQHVEHQRLSSLRNEIASLMKAGRDSLKRDELEVAQARFHSAWMKVHAEPSLLDHETSIAGWLDHARNAANRYQWKQRSPPRNFDQKRDEALLISLMIIPDLQYPQIVARQSINEAMELTIPNDPAWELEREQLFLLDNNLIAWESGPEAALKQLDATVEFSSRRFHERRAVLLEELGRSDEADLDRQQADQFPLRKVVTRFHAGIDHLRRRKFQRALDDFESVLMAEPEHFSARLFEAICFLNLNRPGEAKVALTACIAQCPQFEWNRYYRALASIANSDPTGAVNDLHRALEGRCSETQTFVVLMELGRRHLSQGNCDDAKTAFLKATNVFPTQPAGWLYLTWVKLIQSLPTRWHSQYSWIRYRQFTQGVECAV